ncbi:YkuS family protein [Tuberibacillus sp. Marseille-P3662]|uniref:YkuS family protein n=1 Tax=Tuberibacillus sp. Marseille-P3662 TaxID=1965358 RepID=UPI000A1C9503|nr:YkuS family protein [Tuberibacillus sp. Marseille-P3662]
MAKIAVEQSLTDIKEALESKGYQVAPLKNEEDAKNSDCCVISGQDVNVMGMQDVTTDGSVIDARGLDANQVCEEVDSRLQ